MDAVEKYQRQLFEQARRTYDQDPISAATEDAYFRTPRHLFIKRFREVGSKTWHEVSSENLEEHLATLYADRPLILFGEDDDNIPSTVSQPSFVLRMLDMLQLQPGQKVFELGAGSGWNAALMGKLVGPGGSVFSLEIIPDVSEMARCNVQALGLENVHVVVGDGGEAYGPGAPYDRAIFTAGSYDLPRWFYEQLKEQALLLIVIKNEGGGDNLFLLRKAGDHFESLNSMGCGFVQLRGKYQITRLEPTPVEALPEWADLQQHQISRTPFWWGGRGAGDWVWRTFGIRSFLSIVEPLFRAFKVHRDGVRLQERHYFGLWDKEHHSLALVNEDSITAYGNAAAQERLMQDIQLWVDLGMPSAASFQLKAYPIDHPFKAEKHQWLIKRTESQFLWTLER